MQADTFEAAAATTLRPERRILPDSRMCALIERVGELSATDVANKAQIAALKHEGLSPHERVAAKLLDVQRDMEWMDATGFGGAGDSLELCSELIATWSVAYAESGEEVDA